MINPLILLVRVKSRHLEIVRAIATAIGRRESPPIPCDITDLESTGNFALFEAFQQYHPRFGSFEVFTRLVVWRAMMRHVETMRAKREVPLKTARREISPASPENIEAERQRNASLRCAVGTLSKRLQYLVYVLYEKDIPQRELARRCGITEGRLWQLKHVAIGRLRAGLDKSSFGPNHPLASLRIHIAGQILQVQRQDEEMSMGGGAYRLERRLLAGAENVSDGCFLA